jgi:DNA-binding LacI/PurR family transcriptional regulator
MQDEERRLDLLGVQVVVAGGRLRDYPHVEVDDHHVATQAMQHLLSLGHRRIAMIRTSDTTGAAWSSDLERTRGYHDALVAAGITPRPEYLVTQLPGVAAGATGVAMLLDLPDPPTAVFAYSDEIAFSAWAHLTSRGLRVPDHLSLVGVDGHPLAELVGLTTVTQDVHAQGRHAAEMTLALLRGEQLDAVSVVVPSVLTLRGSTARAPGAAVSGRASAASSGPASAAAAP